MLKKLLARFRRVTETTTVIEVPEPRKTTMLNAKLNELRTRPIPTMEVRQ